MRDPRKMLGGSLAGSIIIYAILTGVMLSMVFPFIHELAKSLSYPTEVNSGRVTVWPREFTWGNYIYYYRKHMLPLLRSFGITTYITVVGTIWSVSMTALVAFPISRSKAEFRLGPFVIGLAVFSIIFQPPLIPYFLTIKSYGLMNSVWAIIIPHSIIAFHLILLRTFFRSIPNDLYDACRIDGGNDFRMFWQITVPLSKPALSAIAIFTAVILWNIFRHALFFIRDADKMPLQLFIRSIFAGGGDIATSTLSKDPYAESESIKSALIILTTLPITLVYIFLQKHFVKGLMLGAVKQ